MTNKHGIKTEGWMEEICHRLFGRDLVLRSPVLIEESGPKELTDVLVIVDDTAIIVQSKSLIIEASELDEIKFMRIKKRQTHAKRQLSTVLNAHNRNAQVRATTSTGINFNVDWSRIRHKIGIVTLNLPDSKYEDPEFRFQYPFIAETHKGIEIHTFLLRDLAIMSSELTTPADVLLYLRARSQCIETGKFIIGNELDLLAFYKIQYKEIEKALSDPKYHIWIQPGFWEGYHKAHAEKIQDREVRFQNSTLIDRLIEYLHNSVDSTVKEFKITPQESAINYMTVIGKLSKLTRVERVKIADKIMEKFEKTKHDKWGYFIYVSQLMDIGYLFLILNEEDLEKRRNFLDYLCEQACHIISCRELVGIVTEGALQEKFSCDVTILEVESVKTNTQPDPEFKMFQQPVYGTINEWDS